MKDWPEIEGFRTYDVTTFATTEVQNLVEIVYKSLHNSDDYRWISCHKDGSFWVQTDPMRLAAQEGLECKTLDEAVATINALAVLGVKT